jgi:hypothetical protein
MTFKVKFSESNQSFKAKFDKVYNISDGGYERGLEEGYAKGEAEGRVIGYAEGEQVGISVGYENGKNEICVMLLGGAW